MTNSVGLPVRELLPAQRLDMAQGRRLAFDVVDELPQAVALDLEQGFTPALVFLTEPVSRNFFAAR